MCWYFRKWSSLFLERVPKPVCLLMVSQWTPLVTTARWSDSTLPAVQTPPCPNTHTHTHKLPLFFSLCCTCRHAHCHTHTHTLTHTVPGSHWRKCFLPPFVWNKNKSSIFTSLCENKLLKDVNTAKKNLYCLFSDWSGKWFKSLSSSYFLKTFCDNKLDKKWISWGFSGDDDTYCFLSILREGV